MLEVIRCEYVDEPHNPLK